MKPVKIFLGLALLSGVALVAWFHFFASSPQGFRLYGNVDYRQVELTFLDTERIAEVLVQEGMEVQPGQVLARLETRRLRDKIAVSEAQVAAAEAVVARLRNGTRPEEIDQAKAVVASARAELAFAESQHHRITALWRVSAGKGVKKQEVDDVLRMLDIARAKLEQTQQALQLAEAGSRPEDIAEGRARLLQCTREVELLRNQLDDANLKSPIKSVVSRRLLEPGDMSSPQRAVLTLAVLSPKWVRAYVSETDLGRIRQGMAASVHTDSNPQGLAGTVGFIASVAEFTPKTVQTPELRTSLVYEVRVYVEDPQNVLRLGMPATVLFPLSL